MYDLMNVQPVLHPLPQKVTTELFEGLRSFHSAEGLGAACVAGHKVWG